VETEGEARRRHDLENVPFDEPAAGDPATVVLDEIPLPRMFVPGKIAHVYTHDGGYKAAYVPRSFRDLRRISLASNMITDHKTRNYYEAMLEVRNVRRAPSPLPAWAGFASSNTCSCCASNFTWASNPAAIWSAPRCARPCPNTAFTSRCASATAAITTWEGCSTARSSPGVMAYQIASRTSGASLRLCDRISLAIRSSTAEEHET